jgi:ATP/maltotriose-dependent transcriptional regulator MalT
MQIIAKKISAPALSPKLLRPRLLNILEESVATQAATVVCGRAGTGKTSLAAEFAQKGGRRSAWFKVDGADDDAEVFFRYFFAAVRANWPRFCERWERLFRITANEFDMHALAEHIVGEMQERQDLPMLIVLDDLHLIYDAPWLTPFFTRLIPLLPCEVHLLICGRSLPPGPWWRARSKQVLTVIDEAALAFTADEISELFGDQGTVDKVAGALKETRGRAAVVDDLAVRSGYRLASRADLFAMMA